MPTTTQQDRAKAADAVVRTRLVAWDSHGGVAGAWHALQAARADLRRTDPGEAMRLDARLAGWLVQTLSTWPAGPSGHAAGPPSVADLIAAYEQPLTQTARQR